MQEQIYAGFWIRVLAAIIDSILVLMILAPLVTLIYGTNYWSSTTHTAGIGTILLNYALPAIAVIVFWIYKSATPGKMLTKLVIVDANTGAKPSTGQFIGRYLSYYISVIPFLLGLIWVGIDSRKQGWHDKLAGTVVIRQAQKKP